MMLQNLMTLDDVQLIDFQTHEDVNGLLVVYEKQVPFKIKRVFTVHARHPSTRGNHAHRKCTQLLVCLNGKCVVECDDGTGPIQYSLEHPSQGLLIPPTLWARQHYEHPDSTLLVLCDKTYKESDYIRKFDEFLKFRKP